MPSYRHILFSRLHRLSLESKDVENITTLAIPLYIFKFREDMEGWNIEDVGRILRRYRRLEMLILTEEPTRVHYGPYEEKREPVFSEAVKWQPSDEEKKVMTNGYLHVNIITGKLKMAEGQADDGWKMPEIRYMAVQRG